ncbi:Decaprenyl diphosphate synthase-like [Sesbania bispinosa]|nr:Decaprenyl diphosphate synthase-like [Sesbania bispinosa]
MGPMPNHITFIMDGNKRYEKKQNLKDGDGHRAGFSTLLPMLRYYFEFGVKYTVHAVQESYKDKRNEVQAPKEENISNGAFTSINQGLKRNGLNLHIQDSSEYYLNATKACNNLLEGLEGVGKKDSMFEHNVDKQGGTYNEAEITSDMAMEMALDPGSLIQTYGEARLNNFLLWQTIPALCMHQKYFGLK